MGRRSTARPGFWRSFTAALAATVLVGVPAPIPAGPAFVVAAGANPEADSGWIYPLPSPVWGEPAYRDYLQAIQVTSATSVTAVVHVRYTYPGLPAGPVEIHVTPMSGYPSPVVIPGTGCSFLRGWDQAVIRTAGLGIAVVPMHMSFEGDCESVRAATSFMHVCMATPVDPRQPVDTTFVCRDFPYQKTWGPTPRITAVEPANVPSTGGLVSISGEGLEGARVAFTVQGRYYEVAALSGSTDRRLTLQFPALPRSAVGQKVPIRLAYPWYPDPYADLQPTDAAFTIVAVAVVIVEGLTSAWPATKDDGFWYGDGIARRLSHDLGLPVETFSYSTKNAKLGGSYTACDTMRRVGDSAGLLDRELAAYAASHPNTDVYLVGHSLGGVVGLGYAALLAQANRLKEPYPGTGTRVAGVVTLDSPLGGVRLGQIETGVYQEYLLLKCLTAGVAAPAFGDLWLLGSQGGLLRGWPWGGTGSIATLLATGGSTVNDDLAKAAAAADVRVLTIGNLRDLSFTSSGLGSTQWLSDAGDRDVYARAVSVADCPYLAFDCVFHHGAVLTNAAVRDAVYRFLRGSAPGLDVPGSPLAVAVSATMDAAGGILSAANGLIRLAVPAGAVAVPGTASLASVDAATIPDPIPAGQALAGPPVSVALPALASGASATLTLPLDLSTLGSASSAAVFRDGAWVRMPTKVDLVAGTATATITEGGVYAPLTVPAARVTLADAIAPGIKRGSTGFTTGTVTVPVGGWVTYKITTKPKLAGKSLVIWSRVGTGPWQRVATRTIAADGTARYYAKVRARTTFRATWPGDEATVAAVSAGRTVRVN